MSPSPWVRRSFIAPTVLALFTVAPVPVRSASAADAGDATRAELVMGSIATITLPKEAGDAAFEAGFAAFRAVDASMSLYRPESPLVRVNAHAAEHAEPVDADLFACLERARALSEATDGAFDVTVLPLLRAWGAYPGLAHLAAGRADAVGWEGMLLDPAARAVRFQRAGMGIDLGGIAKGFALDRARAALVAHGVRRGVLDLGGNLALIGAGSERGWRIAVRDPGRSDATLGVLTLDANQTVSTSGNYARDFATEGWRTHSHIYDPRTGTAVAPGLAVTVWTEDATAADALSTALLVLGPESAADVLARRPDVGVLFVDDRHEERRLVLAGRAPRDFEPRAAHTYMTASTGPTETAGW